MRFLLAALVAVVVCTVLPVLSAHSAAAQGETLARLDVTKITPSVITGVPSGDMIIEGWLTNTSGHVISDVQARIQRGNPTTTEPATQRTMREGGQTLAEGPFTPVVDRLAPGQQIPFKLHVPLTGANSLQLREFGVYPLLVNVNGSTPGGRARIAEARFLLPVLGERPAQRTPTSMVVPIVDYPRLELEAIPGTRTVLVDDQLSASLAPGGRLFDLVQAVADRAGPGSPLGSALCFAIDPDLLVTVDAMRNGYLVRQPDGSLKEGIGAGAAGLWLSKLRDVVSGRCVIALPYADADLVALGRAGLPDMIEGAMDGTNEVRRILQVEPRRVLWPIDGALDEPAASQLPGIDTVLVEPQAVNIAAGSLAPAKIRGHNLTAIPIDPLLTSALDPLHDTPQRVTALSPPQNGALSAQNTLGALTFRSTQGFIPNATSVLVPPRRWNLRGDDLRSLFDGMRRLVDAGFLQPTHLLPDTRELPQADLTYPVTAGSTEIPQPLIKKLAAQNFKVGDLYRSSSKEPSTNVDPARVTNPLRNSLLHGASSAWRGNPDAAGQWVDTATRVINEVLGKVRIEEPLGQITRVSSSDSPTPVTVVNDLPITIRLVFDIPSVPGVQVQDDFGAPLTVPANGRRPFYLQTTAQRAGKFTIDVSITTEAGTPLGTTKRLQLESTNYGALIPWLTGIAAVLLVIMSALRIVKRVRARLHRTRQADPPSQDEAEVNEADSVQSATTDSDRDGQLRS